MLIYLIFVRVVLVSCCSVYGARLGCIKSVRLNWRPWNCHVPVECAVHAWGSFDFSCLIWEHKLVQPCIFHAHSQVHDHITLYLLPWGRYEEAVQTNNISRPPEQKKLSFPLLQKLHPTITSANVSSQGWRALAVQASCCCWHCCSCCSGSSCCWSPPHQPCLR